MKYPFVPKSNLEIKEGEYWNIPLSNGENAFVMFIDLPSSEDRKHVYIGLLNCTSKELVLPEGEYSILWQRKAHVKTVKECGGQIRGILKAIEPKLELDSAGGQNCNIVCGFKTVRKATNEEIAAIEVQKLCGYMVPKNIAEKRFCGG
jgi:hypothetical protein